MELHAGGASASPDPVNQGSDLARRVSRLAAERATLFDRAGTSFGLSDADKARLRLVEQQLDECFLARRAQRAERNARRFGPHYTPRSAVRKGDT
jgi:hypothetical protein